MVSDPASDPDVETRNWPEGHPRDIWSEADAACAPGDAVSGEARSWTVLEREKVLTRRRDGPREFGDRAVVPVTSCPRASSQSFSSGRVSGRLDTSGPSYGSARLCRRLPSS